MKTENNKLSWSRGWKLCTYCVLVVFVLIPSNRVLVWLFFFCLFGNGPDEEFHAASPEPASQSTEPTRWGSKQHGRGERKLRAQPGKTLHTRARARAERKKQTFLKKKKNSKYELYLDRNTCKKPKTGSAPWSMHLLGVMNVYLHTGKLWKPVSALLEKNIMSHSVSWDSKSIFRKWSHYCDVVSHYYDIVTHHNYETAGTTMRSFWDENFLLIVIFCLYYEILNQISLLCDVKIIIMN